MKIAGFFEQLIFSKISFFRASIKQACVLTFFILRFIFVLFLVTKNQLFYSVSVVNSHMPDAVCESGLRVYRAKA